LPGFADNAGLGQGTETVWKTARLARTVRPNLQFLTYSVRIMMQISVTAPNPAQDRSSSVACFPMIRGLRTMGLGQTNKDHNHGSSAKTDNSACLGR
jgi:hypothetical protein